MASVTPAVPFDRGVFVNCPFDDDFLPILHAILFAIHDCGFVARIAVEDIGSNETRLDKIARIIRESRYSIHDISRVEITPTGPAATVQHGLRVRLGVGGDPVRSTDWAGLPVHVRRALPEPDHAE